MATPLQPPTRKPGVLLAAPEEPLGSCLDQMAAANVGSILITEQNRPVGILTERDVLRRWREMAEPGAELLPVGQFCTKPVYCLTLDELSKVPEVMLDKHIRHVPLVDSKGGIVGIVSIRDILRAVQRAGSLPKLTPMPPSPPGLPVGVMHVLTPTAELQLICRRFLPTNWQSRVWQSTAMLLADSSSLAGPGGEHAALFLDLDGLAAGEDWRPLIKHFVGRLSRKDQPALFLVSSPPRFATKELDLLHAVAAKAKWHVYQRPLPISALVHDLHNLNAEFTSPAVPTAANQDP